MARPEKHDVDYFPFYVKDGRTLHILEDRYGCTGTGVFTNILRFLCTRPDHHFSLEDEGDRLWFFSSIKCDEKIGLDVLSIMSKTGKIHRELWEQKRVIASQDLLDSVRDAYQKRKNECVTIEQIKQIYGVTSPGNTEASEFPAPETPQNEETGPGNTQKRKEKKRKKQKGETGPGNPEPENPVQAPDSKEPFSEKPESDKPPDPKNTPEYQEYRKTIQPLWNQVLRLYPKFNLPLFLGNHVPHKGNEAAHYKAMEHVAKRLIERAEKGFEIKIPYEYAETTYTAEIQNYNAQTEEETTRKFKGGNLEGIFKHMGLNMARGSP